MASIDVQQIDGSIAEVCQGFIEPAAEKLRKAAVVRVMEAPEIVEHLLPIAPWAVVFLPAVDRIATCVEPGVQHRFAESGIGYAIMGPKLDDRTGPRRGDEPIGEGYVREP